MVSSQPGVAPAGAGERRVRAAYGGLRTRPFETDRPDLRSAKRRSELGRRLNAALCLDSRLDRLLSFWVKKDG